MFNLKKKENVSEEKNLFLSQKIEAILFFKGEEVTLNFLAKILKEKKNKIKMGVLELEKKLKNFNSALILIKNNDKFLLSIRSEFSSLIEEMKEKENLNNLSPSSLEALSIILYKKEIDRFNLDEIRGVNSSNILRNLLIRGLIEKKNNDNNIKYTPTLKLLSYLGVDSIENLPFFQDVKKKIEILEENNKDYFNENE